MDLQLSTLAYRFVAILAMFAEAQYVSERLGLPVSETEIAAARARDIGPPRLIGFAGTVEAGGFVFSFLGSGRLRFLTRVGLFSGESLDRLQKKSPEAPIIATNAAYRLATNWLCAISVDVQRLEREHRPLVRQKWFSPLGTAGTKPKAFPILDVKWGDWDSPAISVSILGTTGQLLEIRQEDESFSRRPKELLVNVEGLLDISDAEFLKLSEAQRKDLFRKFALAGRQNRTNSTRRVAGHGQLQRGTASTNAVKQSPSTATGQR
jgi:hypothetical protein